MYQQPAIQSTLSLADKQSLPYKEWSELLGISRIEGKRMLLEGVLETELFNVPRFTPQMYFDFNLNSYLVSNYVDVVEDDYSHELMGELVEKEMLIEAGPGWYRARSDVVYADCSCTWYRGDEDCDVCGGLGVRVIEKSRFA